MKCILINFNVGDKPRSGSISMKRYRVLYDRMLVIIKSSISNLEGTRKIFNTTH